jgi:hypothetical protein
VTKEEETNLVHIHAKVVRVWCTSRCSPLDRCDTHFPKHVRPLDRVESDLAIGIVRDDTQRMLEFARPHHAYQTLHFPIAT